MILTAPIRDPCTNFCYPGVVCSVTEYGEPKCGACPQRHTGDGRSCERLPTCADGNHCSPLVRCSDTAEGPR